MKLICPICDHLTTAIGGYGFAAGPMGMYIYCDTCDNLIDFMADLNHIDDQEEWNRRRVEEIAALYYHIECARIIHHEQ